MRPRWLLTLLPTLACDKAGANPKDTGPASDTADSSDPADPLSLDGACDLAERLGGFAVESNPSYALVTGLVRDGVVPADVLDLAETEGECALWRRTNPACDPACGADQTCAEDGTCIPYPLGLNLGTVTVTGLLAEVSMSAVEPDKSYFNTGVPNPPWTEGARVTLEASADGALGAFTLDGVGLSPLEGAPSALVVDEDSPLALSWTPAPDGALSTVRLELTIDQHGLTPLTLVCTFEDDGEGEVPSALLTDLVRSGVSGFPNGRLERQTADRAELGGGCIDLELNSVLLPDVSVAGSTPCTDDEDCPEGQTCDEAMEICE